MSMKGLDLHRAFFEECGLPLLRERFPEELPKLAVASVGFGSDRFGADDESSRDHCWEPGFQIFSARLDEKALSAIEAHLYENLPWEFRGFRRSDCPHYVNGIRAWTIDEFFSSITSFARPPEDDLAWLRIMEEDLFNVTNGEVFHDPSGDLTGRREVFRYYPENVWRFKLAGRAFRVGCLLYQLERSLAHGEAVTAHMMLSEALRETMRFTFLVNRRYAPYDRWLHWGFRRLPLLAPELEPLVLEACDASDGKEKARICRGIVDVLTRHVYGAGLAKRGERWWHDLWQAVDGRLREFPLVGCVGAEYRYASQFALGNAMQTTFSLRG